jgi:hypothetical protein
MEVTDFQYPRYASTSVGRASALFLEDNVNRQPGRQE